MNLFIYAKKLIPVNELQANLHYKISFTELLSINLNNFFSAINISSWQTFGLREN